MASGRPYLRIVFFKNFNADFLSRVVALPFNLRRDAFGDNFCP